MLRSATCFPVPLGTPHKLSKLRIARPSIIMNWIMSFEILAHFNILHKISSEWAGPYTRQPAERMVQNKYTLNQKADHPYKIMLRNHINSSYIWDRQPVTLFPISYSFEGMDKFLERPAQGQQSQKKGMASRKHTSLRNGRCCAQPHNRLF